MRSEELARDSRGRRIVSTLSVAITPVFGLAEPDRDGTRASDVVDLGAMASW